MKPMHGSGSFPILPLPGSAHPIERNVSIGSYDMSNRLFRLMERHQKLDELLRRAQARRFADPFEISRLKKLKLAKKDAIERIAREQRVSVSA